MLIITLTAIFLSVPSVLANDPSSMTLEYDENTNQLNATITHSVGGVQSHYIQEVQIKINSTLNQTHPYTNQSGDTFTYNYTVDAAPGSTIEVTAICSIAGSITRSIIVPGGQNGTPEPQSTIPLNFCVVGIWSFVGMVLLVTTQKKKLKYKQ